MSEVGSRLDPVSSFVDEGNDCKFPPMKKKRLSLSLKRKGNNDEQKNSLAKLSEFALEACKKKPSCKNTDRSQS